MKRAVLLRFRMAAMLTAGTLLAAACTSGADVSNTASTGDGAKPKYRIGMIGDQRDPGKPVDGGTLTVAAYTEARSLDPTKTIATGASGGMALAAIYDVLVRYNPKTHEYEPWLAKSLEHDDDYTKWTLSLRDGVTFSDGTPFTASAVVDSIRYYMSNHGYNTRLLTKNIKAMTTKDPATVQFRLHRPWPGFPSMLAQGPGMIMAPAAYDDEKFQPIGAGPSH